jgi:hypothetical protein
MSGTKPANPPAQSALPLSEGGQEPKRAAVGPGLSSLLQGQRNGESPAALKTGRPENGGGSPARPSHALTWTLLAADVLLIILAVWLVAGRPGRPGFWEILLCVLALSLGAWLGCCAFLWRRRDEH